MEFIYKEEAYIDATEVSKVLGLDERNLRGVLRLHDGITKIHPRPNFWKRSEIEKLKESCASNEDAS